MRSIVDKILPTGLLNDEQISKMTEEEKKELYQKQKNIIQEFQKRSDQEIFAFTSVLRNLNEDLLLIRKNQVNIEINQKLDKDDEELQPTSKQECVHIEHSPPRFFKSNKRIISHQRQFSLGSLTPKKPINNYRPPFRH